MTGKILFVVRPFKSVLSLISEGGKEGEGGGGGGGDR